MRISPFALMLLTVGAPAFAADVYFNDFNGAVRTTYPEWTSSGYTNSANRIGTIAAGSGPQAVVTAASPNGKQRFLGEFGGPAIVTAPPYDPQHFVRVDETVTLTLRNLEPHTVASVAFDLYVLKSWDGNNPNYGPDRWSLSVQGGPMLLDTTFSNNPKTGAYDLSLQNYPVANSAYQSGAAAVNTLGYTFYGDSIYHLTFTFEHTGDTLVLNFSSSMFEGKGTDDESWGLDNVRVSTNQDAPIARSAAAQTAGLAPEALGSIYGLSLASATQTADSPPWPNTLAGVTVTTTDSLGSLRQAPLLYVSPNQINFQIPTGTHAGMAAFTVRTGVGDDSTFQANIDLVAPGLFTASGDGRGVVAATAIRTLVGSAAQSTVAVFQCGAAAGSCHSVPIDVGVDAPVYVSLYCTGIRGSPAGALAVLIAGQPVPVLYAGPQPVYNGLDQINIALPLGLRGSGEVDVVIQVNGALSNTGRINVM
jgi:uncharacterized protein (TIGR03437 family)